MNPDWPATQRDETSHMVRRDRYGEPIEDVPADLELHGWDGNVRHALRTAREALPPREADVRDTRRREGLKGRLEARQRAVRRRS